MTSYNYTPPQRTMGPYPEETHACKMNNSERQEYLKQLRQFSVFLQSQSSKSNVLDKFPNFLCSKLPRYQRDPRRFPLITNTSVLEIRLTDDRRTVKFENPKYTQVVFVASGDRFIADRPRYCYTCDCLDLGSRTCHRPEECGKSRPHMIGLASDQVPCYELNPNKARTPFQHEFCSDKLNFTNPCIQTGMKITDEKPWCRH